MDKVREKIEKWYQERGLPFCYVGYFDGMEEGTLRANVIEAKINDVSVRYTRMKVHSLMPSQPSSCTLWCLRHLLSGLPACLRPAPCGLPAFRMACSRGG